MSVYTPVVFIIEVTRESVLGLEWNFWYNILVGFFFFLLNLNYNIIDHKIGACQNSPALIINRINKKDVCVYIHTCRYLHVHICIDTQMLSLPKKYVNKIFWIVFFNIFPTLKVLYDPIFLFFQFCYAMISNWSHYSDNLIISIHITS